jgi:hypothetical protein
MDEYSKMEIRDVANPAGGPFQDQVWPFMAATGRIAPAHEDFSLRAIITVSEVSGSSF